MRAGYSGSQRFGIIPWSGDVNRGWDGLQSQVEIALQMGMQGLAYMHSDLGGFANPNLDDELYVRWLQYGVFQPIFRPHAQEEVPSEPVYRSEHAKKLAKKAIELRYRLLPYNYDLVFRNHTEGKALMRPLFFEEPNNEKLYHCKDAYMWGNNFLVAPVTEAGQKTREIYLPRSADWYDFNTGEIYHGGETIQYQLNEDYIPVFVKAGSLIPMTSNIRNTSEYDGTNLILHYFPLKKNNSGEFSIYNDDGLTANSYKKGKYEMINISISQKGKKLYFDISEKTGKNWKQKARNIKIVVHGEKYRIINQQ